jgi:hypothetical protein
VFFYHYDAYSVGGSGGIPLYEQCIFDDTFLKSTSNIGAIGIMDKGVIKGHSFVSDFYADFLVG